MTWKDLDLFLHLAMGAGLPALLLWTSGLNRRQRWILWAISTGWLAVVTTASAAGLLTPAGLGMRGLGLLIAIPFGLLILFRKAAALQVPGTTASLGWIVGMHVGRIIGVEFLVLHAQGNLPPTFAHAAGWGDVLTAVLAVPVAVLIYRGTPSWRMATLVWNVLGTLDLVAAMALGVGSSSTFPLRFVFQTPPTDAMGSLPLFLIPGFLVPFYLLTHVLIFRRLIARRVTLGAVLSAETHPPVSKGIAG